MPTGLIKIKSTEASERDARNGLRMNIYVYELRSTCTIPRAEGKGRSCWGRVERQEEIGHDEPQVWSGHAASHRDSMAVSGVAGLKPTVPMHRAKKQGIFDLL